MTFLEVSRFDKDRLRGLRRWRHYLQGRFRPSWIVRETADEPDRRDAAWRVEFPDGIHAHIRVKDEALRLDRDRFELLVGELERANCLRILWAARPDGIRIYPGGQLKWLWFKGSGKRRRRDEAGFSQP